MRSITLAHATSFPLFSLLMKYEGSEPWEALEPIQTAILSLDITKDIELVVTFDCGSPLLGLVPKTEFGREVCDEILARGGFPPCPPNSCEFNGQECRWCGRPLTQ